MPKLTVFAAAVPAAVLILALSACAGPADTPSSDPAPTPSSSEPSAPVGTGDFVPDDAWFGEFETARASLVEYSGWWDSQDCTYQKVIDGDFNCTIHIAGLQEGVTSVEPFLTDVINIAPGSEDLVAGLTDAAALAPQASAAVTAYTDSGCDFSPGDSCTDVSEAMVDAAQKLAATLEAWTAPAAN